MGSTERPAGVAIGGAESSPVAEALRLAEKMMRDSWATGSDASWQGARADLEAHLKGMAPQADRTLAQGGVLQPGPLDCAVDGHLQDVSTVQPAPARMQGRLETAGSAAARTGVSRDPKSAEDTISRCKRILDLVDTYVLRPDHVNRTALRIALMGEFEDARAQGRTDFDTGDMHIMRAALADYAENKRVAGGRRDRARAMWQVLNSG